MSFAVRAFTLEVNGTVVGESLHANSMLYMSITGAMLVYAAFVAVLAVWRERRARQLSLSVPVAQHGRPCPSSRTHLPSESIDGLLTCVEPYIVADIDEVSRWFRATPPGAPLEIEGQPPRLRLDPVEPEAFVMISYMQAWCRADWSVMAAELDSLAALGWRRVWIDVGVLNTREAPYVQAEFEAAMRWAVHSANAVFCPPMDYDAYLDRP